MLKYAWWSKHAIWNMLWREFTKDNKRQKTAEWGLKRSMNHGSLSKKYLRQSPFRAKQPLYTSVTKKYDIPQIRLCNEH